MKDNRELQSIYVSWKRVMIRLSRSKGRLFGTMFQPVLFLITFGLGFRKVGGNLEFVLPGILAMNAIMSSAMAGISVIWDREFGFLKEILIAPVSRASAVIGRSLGAITTALIQGLWIGFLGVLFGAKINYLGIIPAFLFLILISALSVGIGLAFSSKLSDFESFQIIHNLIIMPLIFLSTAFIDVSTAPKWLVFITKVNPFSYGINGLRYALTGTGTVNVFLDLGVISVFVVLATIISIRLFEKIEV